MESVKLKARISNGELRFSDILTAKQRLSMLEDQMVNVVISKRAAKRSVQQNNWYYGVAIVHIINMIYERTGELYSKEDIHDWHMSKVIRPKIVTKQMMGQQFVAYKAKKTSEMTTVEFNQFKEEIQKYWAERDIIIPDPYQEEFLQE
jgi:hypothetical protein